MVGMRKGRFDIVQLAKAMSPPSSPPPSSTITVTPPADEPTTCTRETAGGEAYSSISEVPARPDNSPMTGQTDKPDPEWKEHYFSTPVGLLQLSLLEPALQQRSADRRAHWEEKRERNLRLWPGLSDIQDAVRLNGHASGEVLVDKPRGMEELLTLKEFLEDDGWEWVEAKRMVGERNGKQVDDGWDLVDKEDCDEDW